VLQCRERFLSLRQCPAARATINRACINMPTWPSACPPRPHDMMPDAALQCGEYFLPLRQCAAALCDNLASGRVEQIVEKCIQGAQHEVRGICMARCRRGADGDCSASLLWGRVTAAC